MILTAVPTFYQLLAKGRCSFWLCWWPNTG
jgi:hypothetical protein